MVSTEAAGMKNDHEHGRDRAERERDRHAGEHHDQRGGAVKKPDGQDAHRMRLRRRSSCDELQQHLQ